MQSSTASDFTPTAGGTVAAGAMGGPQVLPVAAPFDTLLPWGGLRRGEVVAVAGSTSLALALCARTCADGTWAAVVGVPSLGVAAAAEAGIPLDRLALIPDPGTAWPEVLAALVDALDLVVWRPPPRLAPAIVRKLEARVRQRGVALLVSEAPGTAALDRAPVRLTVVGQHWHGLGSGDGHLRHRQVEVRVTGRGGNARPRTHRVWLPGPEGAVTAAGEGDGVTMDAVREA